MTSCRQHRPPRPRGRAAALLVVTAVLAALGLAPAAHATTPTGPGYSETVVADNTGLGGGDPLAFDGIVDVAVDSLGNAYVSDRGRHVVFRIDPAGVRTVVAGTGRNSTTGSDGPALQVDLGEPYGLAVDAADNLYVSDRTQHRVVVITPGGRLATLAGDGTSSKVGGTLVGPLTGPATRSPLNPIEVAVGPDGTVYAVDEDASAVVAVRDGTLRVVAGTAAVNPTIGVTGRPLDGPRGLVVRADGSLLVSNKNSHEVVSIRGGVSTTVAGGRHGPVVAGPATASGMKYPERIALDEQGNLYVADAGNDTIDVVDSDASIQALPVTLDEPTGVAVAADGSVLIVDQFNKRIVRWSPTQRPVIDDATLTADVGASARADLTGTYTRTWSLVGAVPAGLTLSGSTLTWTPARAGASTVTVQACAWLSRSCARRVVPLTGTALPAGAPRDVAADLTGRTATVTWRAPESDGGSDVLDYALTLTDEATGTPVVTVAAATTTVLGPLSPGHRYAVRVAARTGAGPGAASAPVTVDVPAPPAPVTAPTPSPSTPVAVPTPTPTPTPTTSAPAPRPTAVPAVPVAPAPSGRPSPATAASAPPAPAPAPTATPVPTRSATAVAVARPTTPARPATGSPASSPASSPTGSPTGSPTSRPAPATASTTASPPTSPAAGAAAPPPAATPTAPTGPTAPATPATPAPPAAASRPLLDRLPAALAAPARALATVGVAVVRHAEYPSAVLALAGFFLLVQRRIDRDDPKLALAPVVPDDRVPFEPRDPQRPEVPTW
ncbi:fibronectin type III domain-containing protein [Kineococcus sp. SYSU DK001]|uniref:fibronectin type III domain-containing protein n=1 Tax=Kineococcus sp. SYSU DK001 TaxID=3383122 RepID=UPI003D7EDC7F